MKNLFGIIALILFSACGQSNAQESTEKNVSAFCKNAQDLQMNIEAAGIAKMPVAKITERGDLYIEYAYQSGAENRAGKMTLQAKGNNRYEGNWKTDADNGNSYQGTLYFVFDEVGLAKGEYQFGGTNYDIEIFTK